MPDFSLFEVSRISLMSPDFQFDGMTRVITTADATTLAEAMLTEVLQTQLPRQLTFQNNRDEALSIGAKDGRVITHSGLSFACTSDAEIALDPNGFAPLDPLKLISAIEKLTINATSLKVISRYFEREIPPTHASFCLATVFQSRQAPPVLEQGIDLSLLRALENICLSRLTIDGKGQRTMVGDPAKFETIERVAELLPSMKLKTDGCLVLSSGYANMTSVVATYRKKEVMVGLIQQDDIVPFLSQWNICIAGLEP